MTAHAIQNVRNRYEWAEVINADWRKSIEGIIQTGRDLISAKSELPDGEWGKMIETQLPFKERTTQRLMTIARQPAITHPPVSADIPASWTVLAQLATLSAEDFKDAEERGLIDMKTTEIKANAIVRAYKTPIDKVVGDGRAVSRLPSPQDAKQVARETNRLVAASDGNLYSGATDEEGAEYVRLRDQTYTVIDAINTIVKIDVSPKEWCDNLRDHWLNRFEFGGIMFSVTWLTELRSELIRQKRFFDCEVQADGE